MSDKIADAIRLLVNDGAEIIYSSQGLTNLTQPQLDQLYTDWAQLGAKQERDRITDLLQNELGAGVDIDDTATRDAIIKQLIDLIEGKND